MSAPPKVDPAWAIALAVGAAKACGWSIVPRDTLDDHAKCCCPVGAVLAMDPPPAPDASGNLLEDAERVLGFPAGWFASGFDDDEKHPPLGPKGTAYELGARFRSYLEAQGDIW